MSTFFETAVPLNKINTNDFYSAGPDDGGIVFLGSNGISGVSRRNTSTSNKLSKKPLIFGIPNIQLGKNNFAHLLSCAPIGFSAETERPKPGFQSFVLKIRIKDGDDFFRSRRIYDEDIYDITLEDGTLVNEQDYPDRTVTSFMMYTGSPLIGTQLAKLAQDFLSFVNSLEWKGKLLATRATLLTPSPWMKNEKIGNWIGREGVEKLVRRLDSDFKEYDY